MLFSRAGLRPGESVLVTAAGSGVGAAAIALARYAGARVFTTASTEEKRATRGEPAAPRRCSTTRGRAGPTSCAALTGGRGVDLVVDHVGRAVFADALGVLANKGRIVFCGASSGARAELDLIDLFARQLSIIGSSDGSRRELFEVLRLLGEGRDRPAADRGGAAARAGGRGAGAAREPRALRARAARPAR